MLHDGSHQSFVIKNNVSNLLSIDRTTGKTILSNDVTVGGVTKQGVASMSVVSSTAGSTVAVTAGGTADGTVHIQAVTGVDAKLTLAKGGNKSFEIVNEALMDKFVIRDDNHDLLTIDRGAGTATLRGDFTAGGVATTGPISATVKSTDGDALVMMGSKSNMDNVGVSITSSVEKSAMQSLSQQ